MTKSIKIHKNKNTQEQYLKISDFKSLGYVTKDIVYYTLEKIDDDGKIALILKFYDKDENVIVPNE